MVVVGGIVPDEEQPALLEAGVHAILGPGASGEEIVAAVSQAAAKSSPSRSRRPTTARDSISSTSRAIGAADGLTHSGFLELQETLGEPWGGRLTPAEKALLFDELRHPMTMQQIVSRVASPEMAVEVYAASLVAIDETTEESNDER